MQRPQPQQFRRVATPIALALVSLAVALGLWVAVTDAEIPNEVRSFTATIEVEPVNVSEGLAVSSIKEPVVTLRVSASDDVFRRLTAADFRAQVDMTGERRDTSDKAVIVEKTNNKDVEIVDWTPTVVTVTLEAEASKNVGVKINPIGAPPQGYKLETPTATPTTVRVSGAASLVQLVDSAVVDVTVTGLRASLVQQASLVPRDARGANIRGVTLDPSTVEVRLNVSQQEVSLSLTIVPTIQGSVADGYNLVGITTDPPAIAVSGPLEVLQAISFLTTDPIDVSGLRNENTRTVRLRVPAGLQTSRDSVNVRIRVQPAQGEVLLAVAPRATNVGSGLSPTFQTTTVELRLRGELPLLRSLTAENVQVTVNANDLTAGPHVLQPEVTLPAGVELVSTNPGQIVLVLR